MNIKYIINEIKTQTIIVKFKKEHKICSHLKQIKKINSEHNID